jgi:hypothetical protein
MILARWFLVGPPKDVFTPMLNPKNVRFEFKHLNLIYLGIFVILKII